MRRIACGDKRRGILFPPHSMHLTRPTTVRTSSILGTTTCDQRHMRSFVLAQSRAFSGSTSSRVFSRPKTSDSLQNKYPFSHQQTLKGMKSFHTQLSCSLSTQQLNPANDHVVVDDDDDDDYQPQTNEFYTRMPTFHSTIDEQKDKFQIDQSFVDQFANGHESPFGFNGLGEVVYQRTYSRVKPDTQEKEQWYETVQRVVNGCFNMQKHWLEQQHLTWNETEMQVTAQDMYTRMFEMKFLPPGRGLWAMGSPITEERGLFAALNNCAFVSTEDIAKDPSKPFIFLMDMAMLGVGVGFDTKGAGTLQVRGPKRNSSKKDYHYIIPDSREGWVQSVKLLIDSFFTKSYGNVVFDYSQIRPEGAPIRGFGGVSSGPTALRSLHHELKDILTKSIGSNLSITAIVDIMNLIGKCVVSGNVRRCVPGDSLVHTRDGLIPIRDVRVGQEVLTSDGYRSVIDWFDQGERELVKIETLDGHFICTPNHRMPILKNASKYEWVEASKLQPGDHLITARKSIEGTHTRLPDCNTSQSQKVVVPDLDESISWLIGFISCSYRNSDQPLTFHFSNEEFAMAHVMKNQLLRFGVDAEVQELSTGFLVTTHSVTLTQYLMSILFDNNQSPLIPDCILRSITSQRLAFVSGVIDGCNRLSEYLLTHKSHHYVHLLQILLYSCGVETRLTCVDDDLFGLTVLSQHSLNVLSSIKQLHRIPRKSFDTALLNSFPLEFVENQQVRDHLAEKNATTISIDDFEAMNGEWNHCPVQVIQVHTLSGTRHTYDIQVQGNEEFFCNGYLIHNTAEIAFGDHESEEFMDLKDYQKNPHRVAYGWTSNNSIFAKIGMDYYPSSQRIANNGEPGYAWLENMQNYSRMNGTADYKDIKSRGGNPCLEQTLESYELCCLVETFPAKHDSLDDFIKTLRVAYLYAKTVTLGKTHWRETNQVLLRNRRIGCSMSGIAQFLSQHGIDQLKQFCEKGYKAIQDLDEEFSNMFSIPRSIKTTSIKPSGTVSLLAGATPGMHYPESRFYIRRLRISKNSPIVQSLRDAGYHVEDAETDPQSCVIEFPVDVGAGIRTAREVSMWEQLSLAAFLQRYWADNQVSCTVTFDAKTEANQIAPALNFFQYQLKGVSLLPRLDGSHAYSQMPYEAISEDAYHQKVASIRPFSKPNSHHEDPESEKYCDSSVCLL